MKRSTRIQGVLLSLLCAGPILLYGGTNPKGTDTAKPRSKPSVNAETTATANDFDVHLDNLPPKFTGNTSQLMDLYQKLNKALQPKGEFETSADFGKRSEEQQKKQKIYAVTIFVPDDVKYDADSQTLDLSCDVEHDRYSDKPFQLLVLSHYLDGGTYVGQNAFGVKKRIKAKTKVCFKLGFRNEDLIEKDLVWYKLRIRISDLPPKEASKIRDSVTILCICKPSPKAVDGTFTMEETEHNGATIDDPLDLTTVSYTLMVDLLEVWAYDFKTGQVLFKKKPGSE